MIDSWFTRTYRWTRTERVRFCARWLLVGLACGFVVERVVAFFVP